MTTRHSRRRYLLVLNTCPNAKIAKQLATRLVREKLAVCINILPIAQSIYRWRGKVESAKEVLLLIKTTAGRYRGLEARIRTLHPYELPEIISVGITGGYAPYLSWITDPDKT